MRFLMKRCPNTSRASADQPWLMVTPDSGTGEATLSVAANTSGLAVGSYHGQVTVTDPDAPNSPQELPVHLYVQHQPNPADSNYVSVSTVAAPTNQASKTAVDVYLGCTQTLESVVIPLTFAGSPYLSLPGPANPQNCDS